MGYDLQLRETWILSGYFVQVCYYHSFSYFVFRKMLEWREEMSPVLMLVRDVEGHVFGGVASTALIPQDHYYGTGDSSLLFRFTGEYPHTR